MAMRGVGGGSGRGAAENVFQKHGNVFKVSGVD